MNNKFQKLLLNKNFYLIGYVLIFAFTILIFSSSIHPLNFDEVEFVNQARIIAETGNPMPEEVWHPPLYIYILAGYMKLFGQNDFAFRFFGLMFFALNLFALRLFIKKIHRSNLIKFNLNSTLFILTILYCIVPLFLQQSLLVDIDNTIHTFFIILLLIVAIPIIQKKAFLSDYIKFSVVLSFLFLSKLFTPLMLLLAIGIALAIDGIFSVLDNRSSASLLSKSKKVFSDIGKYILSSIFGFGIFMLLWYFLHLTIGGDYWFFFKLSFARISSDLSIVLLFKRLQIALHGFSWAVFWLTIPLTLIILTWVYDLLKTYAKNLYNAFFNFKKNSKNSRYVNRNIEFVLLLFFMIGFISYNFWKPTGLSIKYIYPVYVLCLIPAGIFISNLFSNKSGDELDYWLENKKSENKTIKKFSKQLLFILGILLLLIGIFGFTFAQNLELDSLTIANSIGSDHINPEKFVSGLNTIPLTLMILSILSILCAICIFINGIFNFNLNLQLSDGKSYTKKYFTYFFILFSISSIIFLYTLGDYLLGIVYVNPLILLSASFPLILVSILFVAKFIDYRKYLLFLVALIFIYSVTLSVNQSLRNDYQTQLSWTNYGEKGFSQVISELDGLCNTSYGYSMILRKDIGYYVCDKNDIVSAIRSFKYDRTILAYNYNPDYGTISWYDNNFINDKKTGLETYNFLTSSKNIEFIVLDSYTQSWEHRELLLKDYYLYKQIEDFEIYKKSH